MSRGTVKERREQRKEIGKDRIWGEDEERRKGGGKTV